MPIYPLPVFSEEAEEKAFQALKPPKTVVLRYGYTRQIAELPYDGDQVIGCGTKLVVRTPRGVEVAEMLTTTCANSGCGKSVSRQQMLSYIENSGGKQYPFTTEGRVLRVATVEDLNEWSRIESERPRYVKTARQIIADLRLPMKLVEVEQLFSRDRVVFYFTSEHRIDFRELVRQLAKDLHCRVEMRQVGARDEARIVADYEKCGQHCCCKQFLKVLKPISMKAAKIQKATLDPTKISGRCGRLMCCLRYEEQTYDDLRKNLPPRGSAVMTEDGPGTVVNTQILTQLVLVEHQVSGERNAYPVENIERLKELPPLPPGAGPRDRNDGPPERGGRPPQGERGPRSRGPQQRDREQPPTPPAHSNIRRPSPGNPLRNDEVASREDLPADSIDVPPTDHNGHSGGPTPETGNGNGHPQARRPNPPADPPRDPSAGSRPDVASQGDDGAEVDDNAPDNQEASDGGPQPGGDTGDQGSHRRRRRRRRRGRGRGPGPGGPAGESGGPG